MYNIQKPWMDILHAGYGHGGPLPRNEHCTKPGQQIMCFKNIFQSTDPSWQPGMAIPGTTNWYPTNPAQWMPQLPRELDISSTYYADIVKETFIRMMMDPSLVFADSSCSASSRPTGTPATRSSGLLPQLAFTNTPTV